MTVNSCDAYCCCDEKCIIETSDNDQESIVDIWRANDECLPEGTDRDIYSATDCFKSTVNPKLDDLWFGLRILSSFLRSFLCVLWSWESVPYPFVEKIVNASTIEEYDNLLNQTEGYVEPVSVEATSNTTNTTLPSPIGKPLLKSDGKKFYLP